MEPDYLELSDHEMAAAEHDWRKNALIEYARLMEAGPLAENEEALRSLIEQGYERGLYFDYDREQGYVLREGDRRGARRNAVLLVKIP